VTSQRRSPDSRQSFAGGHLAIQFGEGTSDSVTAPLISAAFESVDTLTLLQDHSIRQFSRLFELGDEGRDETRRVSRRPVFSLLPETLRLVLEFVNERDKRISAINEWVRRRAQSFLIQPPQASSDPAFLREQAQLHLVENGGLCFLSQQCLEIASLESQSPGCRTAACLALALFTYIARVLDYSVAFHRKLIDDACSFPDLPPSLLGLLREIASESADVAQPAFEQWFRGEVRIGLSHVEAAQWRVEKASSATKVGPPDQTAELRCHGQTWAIVFRGRSPIHLPDRLGLRLIAVLLNNPGVRLEALRLVQLAARGVTPAIFLPQGEAPDSRSSSSNCATLMDQQGMDDLRDKSESLQQEIESAEEAGDGESAATLRDELERLGQQQRKLVDKRGRRRRFAGPSEKARQSATQAIVRGIQAIRSKDPELAAHLQSAIRRGHTLAYHPVEGAQWRVFGPKKPEANSA